MRGALVLLGLVGCSPEPAALESVPSDPQWSSVSQMLGARCGSLDCHGQSGRPLRLYHQRGLRLDSDESPGYGATTAAEHAANLRAAVGLEPELTAQVFAENGTDPERLTLLRKALGLEKHKGNAVLAEGSAGDECLRSWLRGAAEAETCSEGEDVP